MARALAGRLWDAMQRVLHDHLQQAMLPAGIVKGAAEPAARAALAAHLASVLAHGRDAAVEAALLELERQAMPHAGGLDLTELRAPTSLGLRFTHTCRALGCVNADCGLCKHNPAKRCPHDDFLQPKYLIGDPLVARCGATVCVELYDTATGAVLETLPENVSAEFFVVNGAADSMQPTRRGKAVSWEKHLLNQADKPLLVPGAGARNSDGGAVAMPLKAVCSELPALHVSDSSEALLKGRKATFRLVACVMGEGVDAAVTSQPFVVATRRIKSNLKQDNPQVSDPVAKLDKLGKQTADKLADLHAAARSAKPALHLLLPWELQASLEQQGAGAAGDGGAHMSVTTVGQLRTLMDWAERETGPHSLKKALLKVLKMTTEQWEHTLTRVRSAVERDDRMRKWLPSGRTAGVQDGGARLGALFACKQGRVDLERPLGLLCANADGTELLTMATDLSSLQREQLARVRGDAAAAWQLPQHPGWEASDVAVAEFGDLGMLNRPPGILDAGGTGSRNASPMLAVHPLAGPAGQTVTSGTPRGLVHTVAGAALPPTSAPRQRDEDDLPELLSAASGSSIMIGQQEHMAATHIQPHASPEVVGGGGAPDDAAEGAAEAAAEAEGGFLAPMSFDLGLQPSLGIKRQPSFEAELYTSFGVRRQTSFDEQQRPSFVGKRAPSFDVELQAGFDVDAAAPSLNLDRGAAFEQTPSFTLSGLSTLLGSSFLGALGQGQLPPDAAAALGAMGHGHLPMDAAAAAAGVSAAMGATPAALGAAGPQFLSSQELAAFMASLGSAAAFGPLSSLDLFAQSGPNASLAIPGTNSSASAAVAAAAAAADVPATSPATVATAVAAAGDSGAPPTPAGGGGGMSEAGGGFGLQGAGLLEHVQRIEAARKRGAEGAADSGGPGCGAGAQAKRARRD